MQIGLGISLTGARKGGGSTAFEEGSTLLLESDTSKLLIEGGADAIILEGNQ